LISICRELCVVLINHINRLTPMNNLLEVKNVSKVYRRGNESIYALCDVSFDMQRGEFTAISGPSGSGKSTLLNIIGTFDIADSGQILLEDDPLENISFKSTDGIRQHKIGFIFQDFSLIPVMTALENVELALIMTIKPKNDRLHKATDMLQMVGLENRLHHKPKELSGGEQQRVAIARALVCSPSIVLADEPTANLDRRTALRLIDLMLTINQGLSTTFLFSTHDVRILEAVPRVIKIEDGRIQP